MSRTISVAIVVVLAISLGLGLSCVQAPKGTRPEEFYPGKTITWVASDAVGSNTDLLARAIAPFMANVTGARVKVENTDNQVGLNYAYTEAKADGLTLVSNPADGIAANDILKGPGVLYETEKFNYLANLSPSSKALQISPKLTYKTLEALRQARDLKGAGTTAKGLLTVSAAVMFEILGFNGQVITGFKTKKDTVMAVARGEVDLIVTSDTGAARDANDGYVVNVLTIGEKRSPAIPDVPSMIELGVEVPRELEGPLGFLSAGGTAAALPPGVPSDRVEYLRQVFDKLNNNQELQKEIESIGTIWRSFVAGKELQKQMVALKADKGLAAQLDDILAKYKAGQ